MPASLTQKLDQGGAAHLAWSMLHMIRGEAQNYQNLKESSNRGSISHNSFGSTYKYLDKQKKGITVVTITVNLKENMFLLHITDITSELPSSQDSS